MTAGVMKEVFEWTWSIKLGIIAVTDNTEHSKHFTDDEENTREYILILTRESDERNAAVRCDPAVILCELGMSDNFIESDICCPSQFTPCCCHHPRVCKALRLSPDQEKKRQVAELCCVEQKQASERGQKKQRNQIEIFSCSDLNRVVSRPHI